MDADFELNFLIVKYLRAGGCPEAAELLEATLNKDCNLPSRLDWTGAEHKQSFAQIEKQFPKIRANHLTDLLKRLNQRSLFSLAAPPTRETTLFHANKHLQASRLGFPVVRQQQAFIPAYKKLHLLRRTLGHLSAVFCLVFDKTGRYVFTGADDLLVKMWGTYNGRLYFTFRGASAEISDLAISEDNRLLAAGSTDKIIRVWCLRSASPVAVLAKNTGTITAIHFCPANLTGVPHYLAITSGDGTVSFWRYSYNKADRSKKPVFDGQPTRYHEKMRPGGAQMICASFSPGGLFLATGSVDHHVRVYMMDGKEGPVKVLEQEVHTERVDSILWSNLPELRFASGSKDGTVRIWTFKFGDWHSQQLIGRAEDGRTLCYNTFKQCEENIRVTMTAWSCDDATLTTALSDATLCVWDSKSCKTIYRLKGHKDEVYVLEPHPSNPEVMLSGAHDGSIIVWHINTQSILFQHHNDIQGQGHGAIYDAKWCPNELNLAASDSHGHILFFGCSPSSAYKKCPEEMFFHSDYRPLLRDSAQHVVDEQSQIAPHLLPPPFLVDVEGNPYPAQVQRLVPGREELSKEECLAPNLMETTPSTRRSGDVRRVSGSEELPGRGPPGTPRAHQGTSLGTPRGTSSTPRGTQQPAASNIDQLIAELAANSEALEGDGTPNQSMISDHSYASPGRRHSEQNTGPTIENVIAPSTQDLTRSVWRKRELVSAKLFSNLASSQMRRKNLGITERQSYKMEMAKKKTVRIGLESRHEGIEQILGRRRGGRGGAGRGSRSARTRTRGPATVGNPPPANLQTRQQDSEEEGDESEAEEVENVASDATSDTSLEESDLESGESSSSSTTDYSDWGANNLTPPQRTARKSARGSGGSKPASEQDDSGSETANIASPLESGVPGPSRTAKIKKKKNYSFNPTQLDDIPPEYLPSDWLAQYIPNKSPYFPQMGDEVMYIKQGHVGYINLVKSRNSYRLNMREQQCLQRDDISSVELVKVIGMKHEIRPPRLCCLKLAIMDQATNRLTGENFSIKYHDMNDVLDFLVLRHNYEASVKLKWKPGDRYRCQIEDSWWFGSIIEISPFDPSVPDSPFLSIKCIWDTGDEERLSPWDLDSVHPQDTGYEHTKDSLGVTREEIERFLYSPSSEEWRGLDNRTECKRISAGLEQVMALAIAEPFNYPVDLTLYPDYMLEIEYPMDFSLIKSRLDNQFYRRITAVQFDVRYMATNAESFNRPKTDIVKNARILTELVLKIIQDPDLKDINGEYHRLVQNFKWEDTQEAKPTQGRRRMRSGASTESATQTSPVNPKQWKHDCNDLLKRMYKMPDSEPFREPVSEIDFPDYSRFITTPMDLSSVQETLRVGEYKTPLEMKEDMNLIFANSLKYNTSRKSPIVSMTKRLKEFFLEEFQIIVRDWRKVTRRLNFLKKKGVSPSVTPKKQQRTPQKRIKKSQDYDSDDDKIDESEESSTEEEDAGEGTSAPSRGRRKKPVKYDEGSSDQESTSEETERVPRSGRKSRQKVAFKEDSEINTQDQEKGTERRKLVLSDTDEENTTKDKGKGVSTKALSRRKDTSQSSQPSIQRENPTTSPRKNVRNVRENESEENSDADDIPIAQRFNGSASRKKRSSRGNQRRFVVPDSEEDLSEDGSEETEETEAEDLDLDQDFIDDYEEEEDYKPRHRKQVSTNNKNKKNRRKSSNLKDRPLSRAHARGEKRKRAEVEIHAPRPRRQATARALTRFAESESDDYLSEEEVPILSRRKRSRPERQREDQREVRAGSSADQSANRTGAETVTISAADSSTDPSMARRGMVGRSEASNTPRKQRYAREEQIQPNQGRPIRSSAGARVDPPPEFSEEESGRRQDVPTAASARLGDYSNDELLLEASRRGGRRGREGGGRSREESGRSREESGRSREESGRSREESGRSQEEMGRGKRAKREVRYHEDSFEYRQDESGRSVATRRRSGARPNYLDQSFSNDEDSQSMNVLSAPGRRRSRNAAQHILEVVPGPSHASQQDSGEESDFGRRKRSRRAVLSGRTTGGSTQATTQASGTRRPQRQSAASIVGYRDLESSDEELPSRRRRARRRSYHARDDQESEELSEEDQERIEETGGVSSRGRIRRPNRRLLD